MPRRGINMEIAKPSRIEYEVKYLSYGKCPHCNAEINTEESEVLLDSFGDREIAGEIYHNCLLNIGKIRKTWFEKVKEKIPVVSETQCKTMVVLEGRCPYCSENLTIRTMLQSTYDSPPAPDPSYYKEIHILEYCPECNNLIHISSGNFYNGDECPDHDNIGLPAKAHTGKVGRPKKNKTFECPVCNGRQKVEPDDTAKNIQNVNLGQVCIA